MSKVGAFLAVLAGAAFGHLAPAGARPHSAANPRPIAILIHGGGWLHVGPYYVATMNQLAYRYRRRGFEVHQLDYRPGGERSLHDVTAAYDRIRSRSRGPIVAVGASAGGQIALMLARRRRLSAVVIYAAPTDLTNAGPWLAPAIRGAFHPDHLRAYSPALRGVRHTPIFGVYSAEDVLAPPWQGLLLCPFGAQIRVLGPGTLARHFMHTDVSAAGWHAAARAERRFLESALTAR
jgi:acetyl esterase/lipase